MRISAAALLAVPRTQRIGIGPHGEQALVFSFPDRLRSRAELQQGEELPDAEVPLRYTFHGKNGTETDSAPEQLSLISSGKEWYVRTKRTGVNGSTAFFWVRIEPRTALVLHRAAGAPDLRVPEQRFYGTAANLLRAGAGTTVPFSEQLILRSGGTERADAAPVVIEVIGLPAGSGPETSLPRGSWLQEAIDELDPARLTVEGEDDAEGEGWDPALLFAAALAREEAGELAAAARLFHRCYLLDYPFALENELRVRARLTSPFRELYPQIFEEIRRGNRLHALTLLRAVADQFGDTGQAVLAYALRGSGNPDEGLRACDAALRADPDQHDVLGHRWSFYFEKGDLAGMLATAADHLRRYPFEPLPAKNLVHSLRLAGRIQEAFPWVHRYAAFSDAIGLVVQELFELYEAASEWSELGEYFDDLAPLLRHAPPESSVWIGECMIERGRHEEAEAVLFDALSREPQNARIVLAISRVLARSGRELEALAMIESVLRDPTRRDRDDLHALLVTFGAEILRRTGRAEEALRMLSRELPADLVAHAAVVGTAPALECGEALYELGRFDEAAALLARLVAVAPDDPFVRELSALVDHARGLQAG